VASSDRKTTCTLKNQRKKAKAKQSDKKRKAASDQIEELKKRRKRGCSKISAHLRHICRYVAYKRQKLNMP